MHARHVAEMVHLYRIGHLTGLRQLSVNVTQGKGLTNVTVPRKLRNCYWYKPLPHKTVVESVQQLFYFNLLTPNVNYSGRTAPLTSKVAFYIFIQQI